MFQENRGWKKTGMWRNQHTSADKISNKIIIINKIKKTPRGKSDGGNKIKWMRNNREKKAISLKVLWMKC